MRWRPLAMLLLSACTATVPPTRSLYVAEGKHHVAAWFDITLDACSDSDSIAALATDFRKARGNIATYVLQKPCCVDRLVVFTIWESHDDLLNWQRKAHESSVEHPVLIELTR